MTCKKYDVIVVGAGFSGLAAALKLKKAGKETIVLEALTRTGGRVKTDYTPDGTQIDLGGQWIGPTQDEMYRLAKKYNVTIFPTADEGKYSVLYQGSIIEDDPPEVAVLMNKLDELAETVNIEKPWLTPDADAMDKMTFHTWLHQEAEIPDAAEYVARSLAGGLLAVDASEFSLLQMLVYIKSGNGTDLLNGIDGGAQQDRIVGGLQYLNQKMAEDFGPENIYLNQPVRKITYSDNCAEIITSTETFYASTVIISIPAAAMDIIEFSPRLPVMKKKFFDHMMPPAALKCHFVYETPFWRADGLSGNGFRNSGYVFETYDNSTSSGKGVLTIFSYGEEADELRRKSKKQRQKLLVDDLKELYGSKVKNYEEYIEYDWSRMPYTNGCFSSHFSVGGWIGYGMEQNQSVGPLYWAGSEYAKSWNGYCDGAVRSGEAVAKEVLKQLNQSQEVT